MYKRPPRESMSRPYKQNQSPNLPAQQQVYKKPKSNTSDSSISSTSTPTRRYDELWMGSKRRYSFSQQLKLQQQIQNSLQQNQSNDQQNSEISSSTQQKQVNLIQNNMYDGNFKTPEKTAFQSKSCNNNNMKDTSNKNSDNKIEEIQSKLQKLISQSAKDVQQLPQDADNSGKFSVKTVNENGPRVDNKSNFFEYLKNGNNTESKKNARPRSANIQSQSHFFKQARPYSAHFQSQNFLQKQNQNFCNDENLQSEQDKVDQENQKVQNSQPPDLIDSSSPKIQSNKEFQDSNSKYNQSRNSGKVIKELKDSQQCNNREQLYQEEVKQYKQLLESKDKQISELKNQVKQLQGQLLSNKRKSKDLGSPTQESSPDSDEESLPRKTRQPSVLRKSAQDLKSTMKYLQEKRRQSISESCSETIDSTFHRPSNLSVAQQSVAYSIGSQQKYYQPFQSQMNSQCSTPTVQSDYLSAKSVQLPQKDQYVKKLDKKGQSLSLQNSSSRMDSKMSSRKFCPGQTPLTQVSLNLQNLRNKSQQLPQRSQVDDYINRSATWAYMQNNPETQKSNSVKIEARKLQNIATEKAQARTFEKNGTQLFQEGKFKQAQEQYTQAIDTYVKNQLTDATNELSTLYCSRAATQINQRQLLGGIQDCYVSLAYQPKYFRALRSRAEAFACIGELRLALKDIEQAYDFEPTDKLRTKMQILRKRISLIPQCLSNYYMILNVPGHANLEHIKVNYKDLVLQYHPDKSRDKYLKEGNEFLIKIINQAYNTLSDQTRRQAYDKQIKKQKEVFKQAQAQTQ